MTPEPTEVAAPPLGEHAESVHLRALSMSLLEVDRSLVRSVETPIELRIGPARVRLEGGYVTPIVSGRYSAQWEREGKRLLAEARDRGETLRTPTPEERGDREVVGVVWSGGAGSVEVVLQDRADALRLANRVVGGLGEERREWELVAHRDAPLRVVVEEAVLLGVDPQFDTFLVGPDLSVDPYEIVVFGDSAAAEAAARRAVATFDARARVWAENRLDVGEHVAWDRIGVELGATSVLGTFALADLRTDQRFGQVAVPGAPVADVAGDRWLAAVRDTTGSVDARRVVRIANLGVDGGGYPVNGLVGGLPFRNLGAPDPAPPDHARVTGVRTRVFAEPEPSRIALRVRADAQVRVAAVGGAVPWVDLVVPRVERAPGSWVVERVELADGTPLLGRWTQAGEAKAKEREKDDDDDQGDDGKRDRSLEIAADEELPRAFRLVLPRPLAEGESADLHVVWRDTWPLANVLPLNEGFLPIDLGESTGLQRAVPSLLGHGVGAPAAVVATLGLPHGSKLSGAVSGVEKRRWEEGGWDLVESECAAPCRWHSIAVGRYALVEDPAQLGFPAVHARLLGTHYGGIDTFGPETRRVVGFYQGWLPEFPAREVSIVESPSGLNGFVWIAPSHMVSLSQARTIGTMQSSAYWNPRWDGPHLESGVYAHELAHQYFGHLAPPATPEDFWIAESFSELFSCLYVAAAFGGEDCAVRMEAARQRFERPGDGWRGEASLSLAYTSPAQPDLVYEYGPYLLEHVLRPVIGREAFYGALDALLREQPWVPLTTERLQEAFEATSGRDLDEFFATWVHGGFVPALTLTWERAGGHLRGRVESDVPFGAIDVPVRVTVDGVPTDRLVHVVDGAGVFDLDPPAGRLEVALDPDRRVVARARRVVERR